MEQMYLPEKPLRSAVLICLFLTEIPKKRYEKCVPRNINKKKKNWKFSFLEILRLITLVVEKEELVEDLNIMELKRTH